MNNLETLIGCVAAFCTTIAFVPQAIKSYKTRDLSGISLPMYAIFTFGVLMWLLYGLAKCDWPIIIANAITVCLAGSVLVLKIQQVRKSSVIFNK